MNLATILLLIVEVLCSSAAALKILVLLPVPSQSHYFTFKPLIEKLAERSHKVTFIGPFQSNASIKNLDYIVLNKKANAVENNIEDQLKPHFSFTDIDTMFGNHNLGSFRRKLGLVWGFLNYSRITCDTFLNSPIMYDFAAQDRHYDLIIAEAFHTNCWFGFVQKYKAPLVLFTTSAPIVWYHDDLGLPNNPAYIPNLYAGFSAKMSLLEKVQNMLINAMHVYYFNHMQEPINFEYARKFFGNDLQDYREILRNATLFLTNSHFTIMGAKPKVERLLEIGGIHIGTPKKLPMVSKLNIKNARWFKMES